MDFRRLGDGGPLLSVVGLGTNNFGTRLELDASRAVIDTALDAGVTHFDTAAMYGNGRSEEIIGEVLGSRRDNVVLATKFMPRPRDYAYRPGALSQWIRTSCDASLRRLRTDRIDLYYRHVPDAEAPVEEALGALGELQAEGKILNIASSNVSADQLTYAAEVHLDRSVPRLLGTQIEWNLLKRGVEEQLIPAAIKHGIGVVPYYPLASGMLTGKYRKGEAFPAGSRFDVVSYFSEGVATDENFAKVDALKEFANQHGHTVLELAVAWLTSQTSVTSVITGATTPEQVLSNVAAAQWRLSESELAAVPS